MENYSQFRARDYRRMALDKLRGRWAISLGLTLVAGLLGAFGGSTPSLTLRFNLNDWNSGSLSNLLDPSAWSTSGLVEELFGNPLISSILVGAFSLSFIIAIGMSFVGAATLLGHNDFYIQQCNNRNPRFDVLFSRFKIFWKAVGLRYFMGLFIFLWSLLLIVPGIIASYRYALAPYLLAQYPEMGVREAVDRSKQLMCGHKGRLFCLNLSFIGWALLNLLTLGIGSLWLNPYMYCARTAFYLDRTGQGVPLNPAPQCGPQQI